MKKIKNYAKRLIRKFGFDVVRTLEKNSILSNHLAFYLPDKPVIFDVGANIGQTITYYKSIFPDSIIYSFEPSPEVFTQLNKHSSGFPNVTAFNLAIGSTEGVMPFLEYTNTETSSFLAPDNFKWGEVAKTTQVKVTTIDQFSKNLHINTIDLLKIDTQGFEFEVLKGAKGMMDGNRIKALYFEFTFSDIYKGLPKFDEVFKFLTDNNFLLASFYDQYYEDNLLGWTNMLFVNKEHYIKKAAIKAA